jgi:CobQ-like glutamine amidotransferase family enzyme
VSALSILQLYPDELGVAGDRGNVMAVRERLRRAGHEVTVVEHAVGRKLPATADLMIVGNGPLSAMRNVHADLLARADTLRGYVASGVPLFAYGSGAELFGHGITQLDGTVLEGLGILPFSAERIQARKVGYVLTETKFGGLVGFEDNASAWHLDRPADAFGVLLEGGGNSDGNAEGVLAGSLVGTQMGGPVLPLNPLLTDAIIGMMSGNSGFEYAPSPSAADLDRYAERARDVIVSHAKHVFSRI